MKCTRSSPSSPNCARAAFLQAPTPSRTRGASRSRSAGGRTVRRRVALLAAACCRHLCGGHPFAQTRPRLACRRRSRRQSPPRPRSRDGGARRHLRHRAAQEVIEAHFAARAAAGRGRRLALLVALPGIQRGTRGPRSRSLFSLLRLLPAGTCVTELHKRSSKHISLHVPPQVVPTCPPCGVPGIQRAAQEVLETGHCSRRHGGSPLVFASCPPAPASPSCTRGHRALHVPPQGTVADFTSL